MAFMYILTFVISRFFALTAFSSERFFNGGSADVGIQWTGEVCFNYVRQVNHEAQLQYLDTVQVCVGTCMWLDALQF